VGVVAIGALWPVTRSEAGGTHPTIEDTTTSPTNPTTTMNTTTSSTNPSSPELLARQVSVTYRQSTLTVTSVKTTDTDVVLTLRLDNTASSEPFGLSSPFPVIVQNPGGRQRRCDEGDFPRYDPIPPRQNVTGTLIFSGGLEPKTTSLAFSFPARIGREPPTSILIDVPLNVL